MDDETKKLIEIDLQEIMESDWSEEIVEAVDTTVYIRVGVPLQHLQKFAQRLRNAMYGEDYYRGAAQPYGRSKNAV